MPRKATNGSGSIYYEAARKRYVAAITVGIDASGKPIRRKVTGRTQAEIKQRLNALRTAVAADPGLPADMTTARFLRYWLDDVLPMSGVRQATRENYANIVRIHIVPNVGSIRLDQLTPTDVRRMLKAMRDAGKSGNTQRLARAVLRRALRTAEADGLVTKNVAALVDGVSLDDAKQGRTFTPDQARTLLAHVRGTDMDAAVTIMLLLGLRRGELAGLTWDDVTNLNGDGPVRMRIARTLHLANDGTLYVTDGKAKTKLSLRSFTLPVAVVDALRRHRITQNEQRLAFGKGWGADFPHHDFIFTNVVGSPMDVRSFARRIGRMTVRCGFGTWTPHEFRHSCVSLLYSIGVPPKVIAEIVGHSSTRVTEDIYTHVMDGAKTDAMHALSAALV